jgi:K+-sensing histidine kinase KdpD
MPVANRERLAREARVVGLRDFTTPSLEAVERRRWQLWTVALLVMGGLAAGMAMMGVSTSRPFSTGVFRFAAVRLGLVLLGLAFALYVLEKEVHLRRLTRMLMDERVLTAALSNRLKELAALAAVGRAVNSVLDLEAVLDIILSSSLELLEGSSGSVMLLEDDNELRAVCVRGNAHARDARVKLGEGIAGYVAEHRDALLISGVADRQRFRNLVDHDLPVRSAVCVPLINRGEVLGVLNVNGDAGRTFSEYDLRALTLFAGHAAVSIANARLYEVERSHVAELMELDRMKSEFIATVSHELRTPLTAILGSVETMQRRELPPDVVADFLSTIDRQGRRLLRLIEEILDLQRNSAAPPKLNCATIEVAEALEHVLRAEAAVGRAVLSHVPRGVLVEADPEALERIMINLIDNAFVHGSNEVEVEAEVDPANSEMVRLSVLDRGPGISEGDAERIFDRFSRGARVSSPGMGLGLYLVRTLAENQGGTVVAANRPGGGAAFQLVLPASTRAPIDTRR